MRSQSAFSAAKRATSKASTSRTTTQQARTFHGHDFFVKRQPVSESILMAAPVALATGAALYGELKFPTLADPPKSAVESTLSPSANATAIEPVSDLAKANPLNIASLASIPAIKLPSLTIPSTSQVSTFENEESCFERSGAIGCLGCANCFREGYLQGYEQGRRQGQHGYWSLHADQSADAALKPNVEYTRGWKEGWNNGFKHSYYSNQV